MYNLSRTGNCFPPQKVILPEPRAQRLVGYVATSIVGILFEADSPEAAPRRHLEWIPHLRLNAVEPSDAGPCWVMDPERRRETECAQQTCDNQQRKPDTVRQRHVLLTHFSSSSLYERSTKQSNLSL